MVKSATLGGTLDDRQQLTAQILDTVRRFVERMLASSSRQQRHEGNDSTGY